MIILLFRRRYFLGSKLIGGESFSNYFVNHCIINLGALYSPVYNLMCHLRTDSPAVVATRSGKQTHSEGQCREWSAVYYTRKPKAESPLSQGPWAVFVWSLFINLAAAAAAKSLQSCPTLCDPIDRSPPDSSVPGILQARILEWVAISFSSASKWKVKVKSLSRCSPMDCSLPDSSVHGIF